MYGRVKKVNVPQDPKAAFEKALRTAFNILGYKDNTRKQLISKLEERGYGAETVESVVEYMTEKGYLNDNRMMISLVRSMAEKKLYGKRRIVQELRLKKFEDDDISSLDFEDTELSDIDFTEICFRLLKKRGGERDQKTYAFLLRHGHTPSDIKSAYRMMQQYEE